MWVYEKKLQYPVNIKQTNPKLTKIIITQYGGTNGKRIYFSGGKKNFCQTGTAAEYDTFHDGLEQMIFNGFGNGRRT